MTEMNIKSEKPYVDFYKKHRISPVSQDISDLRKHFGRRQSLYRRLGLLESSLKGRSIIEFGPGSGHNALYTYSLQPARYVLVDGNPTGLQECETLFSKYFPNKTACKFVESLIEDYKSDELFDVVLCEGLIPGQKNPQQFLRMVAQFTEPGGICLITCQDVIGYLAEFLRCLIGEILVGEETSHEKKVQTLLPVFEKHFTGLKGMNRSHRDWVLDTIMHRAFWADQDRDMLSIEDAITALDASFDVYGVSPYFFTDWRWYKDVSGDDNKFNEVGINCYRENLHYFLDYRYVGKPQPIEENRNLATLCLEIWRLIARYGHERRQAYIHGIGRKINALEMAVRKFSPVTANALSDFNAALKRYPDITPQTDWGSFSSWWGRGTQYLSFIHNKGI